MYAPHVKLSPAALDAVKINCRDALFTSAITYQSMYITPVGISAVNSAKDRGDLVAFRTGDGSAVSEKAWAVVSWLRNLWLDYTIRRDAIMSAQSIAEIEAVAHDFSNHGPIPYDAFEIETELAAWDVTNLDGMANLPASVQAIIDAMKGA